MSQGFYKPDWPLTIKAIGKLLWICKNLGTIIPMKPFWKKMLDNKIQKTSKWSKTKIMVRKEKVIVMIISDNVNVVQYSKNWVTLESINM